MEVKELLTLSDEVKRLTSVKLSAKMKSASLLLGTTGELRVAVTLANNTIEMHSMKLGEENEGEYVFFIITGFLKKVYLVKKDVVAF